MLHGYELDAGTRGTFARHGRSYQADYLYQEGEAGRVHGYSPKPADPRSRFRLLGLLFRGRLLTFFKLLPSTDDCKEMQGWIQSTRVCS